MPPVSFILTGKWSWYNPVMVSAHVQTAGWSEPWVGWSLMGSWGHNGTQLRFGSYVFRSCLWQLPAGGSCRSRGFQPSHVQRLGRTWQNGAGKRRFSFLWHELQVGLHPFCILCMEVGVCGPQYWTYLSCSLGRWGFSGRDYSRIFQCDNSGIIASPPLMRLTCEIY